MTAAVVVWVYDDGEWSLEPDPNTSAHLIGSFIRSDVVSHAVCAAIHATPEQAAEFLGLQREAESLWSIGQNATAIRATETD